MVFAVNNGAFFYEMSYRPNYAIFKQYFSKYWGRFLHKTSYRPNDLCLALLLKSVLGWMELFVNLLPIFPILKSTIYYPFGLKVAYCRFTAHNFVQNNGQ